MPFSLRGSAVFKQASIITLRHLIFIPNSAAKIIYLARYSVCVPPFVTFVCFLPVCSCKTTHIPLVLTYQALCSLGLPYLWTLIHVPSWTVQGRWQRFRPQWKHYFVPSLQGPEPTPLLLLHAASCCRPHGLLCHSWARGPQAHT